MYFDSDWNTSACEVTRKKGWKERKITRLKKQVQPEEETEGDINRDPPLLPAVTTGNTAEEEAARLKKQVQPEEETEPPG